MPRPANPELADRIVRAAAQLLEERGISGVTMRAVAERVGYSATTIYHHYANKDDLLDHAVVQGLEWFVASTSQADTGEPGAERLRATSRSYVDWGVRNPAMYRLMFEQRLPRPAEGAELERRRRGWAMQREMLADIMAHEPAATPPEDLGTAADLVFVSLHGITSLAISGRLWGPAVGLDETRRRAGSLVDALVDQWIAMWGLAGESVSQL